MACLEYLDWLEWANIQQPTSNAQVSGGRWHPGFSTIMARVEKRGYALGAHSLNWAGFIGEKWGNIFKTRRKRVGRDYETLVNIGGNEGGFGRGGEIFRDGGKW